MPASSAAPRLVASTDDGRTMRQVVDIGHLTAKIPGVTKLVNHLTSKDMPKKEKKDISPFLAMEEKEEADVVISEPALRDVL